jgi:squalene synthase HpnC
VIAVNLAQLEAADDYCRQILRHYENFTVASRLAPRRLRRDLVRVYAYCRTTDDIGDESGEPAFAIKRLDRWKAEVEALFNGVLPSHPVLVALAPTLVTHKLPAAPFLDLIDANLQDQRVSSYEDWGQLHAYCRLSAAPVGRIVLQLFGVSEPAAVPLSDDVCIGLQLANFAQDVANDAERGRCYLLQNDVRQLGQRGAVKATCARARDLLSSGRRLEAMVRGRLRMQLALYRLGGEAILDAIAAADHDTAQVRPVVSTKDRARIVARALRDLIAPSGDGGIEVPSDG